MRSLMNNLLQLSGLILITMETSVVDNEVDFRVWLLYPNLSSYEALSQTPYIIASLGHLLLISAEQDFSLYERRENPKFECIKNPDSFRASVAQVSRGVWQSFHTAHNSMKQIRIKSNTIASDVKKAADIIQKGGKNEWSFARIYLQNTGKMCTECVETAASITKEFNDVASVMKELSLACQASRGKGDNEKKKTGQEVDKHREMKEQREQEKEELKDRYKEEKEEFKEAKKNYAKAVASFPSPWKIILCQCFDGVADVGHDFLIELLKQLLTPIYIPTVLVCDITHLHV